MRLGHFLILVFLVSDSSLLSPFPFSSTAHIEERKGIPTLELMDIFGGWPLIEGKQWDGDSWNFFQTLVNLRLSGVTTKFILKSAVDISLNHTRKRILYVSGWEKNSTLIRFIEKVGVSKL